MKKLFFTIMALCLGLSAQAQNDAMTAILQHGDETSVFKGSNALISAHEAAADGDLITLSDGVFTPTPIMKSISIYGAGYETEASSGTSTTELSGDLYIGVADQTLSDVHLEGIRVRGTILGANTRENSTTAILERLTINKFYTTGDIKFNSNTSSVIINQCVVSGNITGRADITASNMLVMNSNIGTVATFNKASDVQINHCIVRNSSYYTDTNSAFIWTNDIMTFVTDRYARNTGQNSVMRNCLYVGNNMGDNSVVENCTQVALADIFSDAANAYYSADRTYELKQPETWTGTDNTQVGIHGGSGFSKIPATPVVKDLSVEVEGMKLKVTYDAVVR